MANDREQPFDRSAIEPAAQSLPVGARLGSLLLELEPRLVAVAVRITRDPESARDVVQSAFEKVVRHAASFRGESMASTWVHRIVTNEALMWLRSERRRNERPGDEPFRSIADTTPDASESLLRKERRLDVERGLARLCPADRDVLIHCSLMGWSYSDYGARTQLQAVAVKSRAFRARRRLGEVLEDRLAPS